MINSTGELKFEAYKSEIIYESATYLLQEETAVILDVRFEVSKNLRDGLSEAVYQEAFNCKFPQLNIKIQKSHFIKKK
ncbi:MAG TPA: hypothetical protein VD905_17185 [Flavobacteriales bacterium]|nr:hypothetical protein [Flavobacteriales bacterium]